MFIQALPTPGKLLPFFDSRVDMFKDSTLCLINTRVREDSLKELPMLFKICPTPGFHHKALQAAGYKGVKSYFTGLVNVANETGWLGWAGNSTESRVVPPELVVKDFLQSITHSVEDLVHSVSLVTMENKKIKIELERIQLRRINYPSNCFILDFLEDFRVNKSGIKSLQINFQKGVNISTEVQVRDRNLFTERNLNSFSTFSGDRIRTKAGLLSSYFVKTDVEEDFTTNCTSYPNSTFSNYSQCDNE